MVTIKDVAKYAGVSHGTVSNVLKGMSSVSLENVIKVERAIRELGYRPNATARNLKTNRSLAVGIILPNITDRMYAQFYSAAEAMLTESNYDVELFVTHDVPEKETAILSRANSLKFAGVIIATCQPGNTLLFEEFLSAGIKMVFIERDPDPSLDCNSVGCRNDKSVHYAIKTLLADGCKHIALITGPETYSSEQLCVQGYKRALADIAREVEPEYIHSTSFSIEDGFRATVQLLSLPDPPDAILCSSTQLTDGMLGALRYVCNGKRPRIASLSEAQWNDNRYPGVLMLPRASLDLGEAAATLLLENINNAAFFDSKRILINNAWVDSENKAHTTARFSGETIRAAMIEGDMSSAVKSLLPDLYHKHGIKVELDIFPHESLYDFITKEAHSERYDVFSVDILWLKEFAANGLLYELTPIADDAFMESINTQPDLFDDFARFNGHIYAIPHMYCNQLLFYRKDLFENYSCRRRFYEQYKTELKAPHTWAEFNAIARFFTQEYNPHSETEYGTTLGGRYSSAALCEYLTRFYAYGAEVFDHRGRVTLCSPAAIKALQNYCESFLYASPGSPNHWWHEQVSEFAEGKAAMMMMYSSYVSPLMDRNTSHVVGKTSFCAIPGGRPVLGGWSFGINARSKKKEASSAFIQWVSGKDLAIPLTLLGNFSASKTVFESNDIKTIYPWIPKSLEIYPNSVRRSLPKDKAGLSIKRYEQIIAGAVHDSIIGKALPADALKTAAAELTALLENNF